MELVEYQTGEHQNDEFEVMKESTAQLMAATGAYLQAIQKRHDIAIMAGKEESPKVDGGFCIYRKEGEIA